MRERAETNGRLRFTFLPLFNERKCLACIGSESLHSGCDRQWGSRQEGGSRESGSLMAIKIPKREWYTAEGIRRRSVRPVGVEFKLSVSVQ